MIKFTAVWIIVYFVYAWFSKCRVNSFNSEQKVRFYLNNYTTGETIWLFIFGILRLGSVIFGAISGIMLVARLL